MKAIRRAAIIIPALIGFFLFPTEGMGQEVIDGAYIEEHEKTRQVIRKPHLREADVMWEKQIWRVIDNKQKINLPFYFPDDKIKDDRMNLWDVILENLQEGSITAYRSGARNDVDDFSEGEYQWSEFQTEVIEDSCTESDGTKVPNHTNHEAVKRYRLKEVWYFDKQRSVMDVKIIGLAPFIIKQSCNPNAGLEKSGVEFWLYYPECRYVFQNYEAYNMVGDNKSEMRSFDDLFIKRRFDSFIDKESNVYDRKINSYKEGLDALLEAKDIKQKMFELEHDLWSY